MSFLINWTRLTLQDDVILKEKMTEYFKSLTLPDWVGPIEVLELSIGSAEPKIEITQISDPIPEFYEFNNRFLGRGNKPKC